MKNKHGSVLFSKTELIYVSVIARVIFIINSIIKCKILVMRW